MAWDSFLTGRDGPPFGVSRHKWNSIQTGVVLGTAAFGVGVALLLFLLLVPQKSELLEETPVLSLAEAATHKGPTAGPFQLAGKLHTDQPVSMPDNGEAVIAGRLHILAKGTGSKNKREPIVLLDWLESAEQVVLTDGKTNLTVGVPVADLKMKIDRLTRVKLDYEGENIRTQVPVRANVGKLSYSLVEFGLNKPITTMERAVIANDSQVVFLAGIDEGGRIVSPPSGQLSLNFGGADELKKQASWYESVILMLGITLVIAGLIVGTLFRIIARSLRFG